VLSCVILPPTYIRETNVHDGQMLFDQLMQLSFWLMEWREDKDKQGEDVSSRKYSHIYASHRVLTYVRID
jgi:hypothetical protein